MIKALDHWLEKKMIGSLHKKREKIIRKTLKEFKNHHPDMPDTQFHEKLNMAMDRLLLVADATVISEKIKVSRLYFWVSLITALVFSGMICALTDGLALPLATTGIAPLVSYLFSLSTIPSSYEHFLQGNVDSFVLEQEHLISEHSNKRTSAYIMQILEQHSDNDILIHFLPRAGEEKTVRSEQAAVAVTTCAPAFSTSEVSGDMVTYSNRLVLGM